MTGSHVQCFLTKRLLSLGSDSTFITPRRERNECSPALKHSLFKIKEGKKYNIIVVVAMVVAC